jgi:uncharacterized phage-associated protein
MNKFQIQDPLSVANLVIEVATNDNRSVTDLQLQKILFFLQGFFLNNYNSPLLDGDFSKCQFGPVERDVYNEFKANGSSPIKSMALSCNFDSQGNFSISDPKKLTKEDLKDDKIFKETIRFIKMLIKIEPWELFNLTHNHDSWKNSKNEILNHSAKDYSYDEIQCCYKDNQKALLALIG